MFDQVLGGVPTPLKLFIALAAVIALIVIAAWLTKRFGGPRLGSVAMAGRSRQPRLGVLDVLAVDGRRRLVIVRRDNVEHLVMIGGPNDLVVESGILRVPSGGAAQPQREATAVITQREPTVASPEAPTPRPALQPQPAPVRAANPAPPPQPLRPVEQPSRAPRSVDAPSIVPASPAASAPFTPPPPPSKGPAAPKPAPLPAAPTISSVAQTRPASPAPATPPPPLESAPERPAQTPIAPPATIAPSPVRPAAAAAAAIAGTGAARVAGIASPSDIAERLAAALKRPVSPQSRAPEPVKPEPAGAPELAALSSSAGVVSSSTGAESGSYASPEITASAQDPDQASAPEVKPEQRPALADATEPAEDDGDPFSLEADLAALLGRDMGKSKD